ncbi:MAG: hypothetical protein KDI29_16935, partial [Pseudomonadales bacterium]|nr:hypothetical protein [Pseudomonadales bacterium]
MLKKSLSVAVVAALGVTALAPLTPAVAQDNMVNNSYWWPNRLDLSPLRMGAPQSSPLGSDFDYAEAFESLDMDALKADLVQ